MDRIKVFTFGADWGLPSMGPFALKLLAWLELAGVPYEQVVENNPGKGPAGKNPWIELDGERIPDSQRIIGLLEKQSGFDIDAGLTEVERGEGHVWRRAFEEGFHQVLEWELFVHPVGRAHMTKAIKAELPSVVGPLVANRMCAHFEKQLRARGVGRFSPEEIAAIGRADIDALASRLTGRPFLLGDHPRLADVAVFGQIAPVVCWPMHTPVGDYAKSVDVVAGFVDRMLHHCFGSSRVRAA